MFAYLRSLFRSRKDHVLVDGLPVPATQIRLCGKALQDTNTYVETAEREARRLVDKCHLSAASSVLDIGCGHGRLAIGLLRVVPGVKYLGIDIDPANTEWCRRHFRPWAGDLRFLHLDIRNERYHEAGAALREGFQFPVDAHAWDVIFLFSVFSHMREEDMRIYLRDFPRLLKPQGRVVFTTFVEESVPPVSLNPEGYVFEKCHGVLHVVRYERGHLFQIIEESGLEVIEFGHRTEIDHQSVLVLGAK